MVVGTPAVAYVVVYLLGGRQGVRAVSGSLVSLHMACKCGKLRHNKPQLKCEMQAGMAKEKNERKKIASKALGKHFVSGLPSSWQLFG